MIDVLLVTHDQIEECLRGQRFRDPIDSECGGKVGICPVTELIELSEVIKKHDLASLLSFRERIDAIEDGGIRCELFEVAVLGLDRQRLADALFERDRQWNVTGLWTPATDEKSRCIHSVRRLVLRPTEQAWWGCEPYGLAEEIYRQ